MNMKLPAYLQDEAENLVPFWNKDLDFPRSIGWWPRARESERHVEEETGRERIH